MCNISAGCTGVGVCADNGSSVLPEGMAKQETHILRLRRPKNVRVYTGVRAYVRA